MSRNFIDFDGHLWRSSKTLIPLLLIILCLSQTSCVPRKTSLPPQPLKYDLYQSHEIAPKEQLPIDGLWEGQNDHQVQIDRGRMLLVKSPNTKYSPGMVLAKDIERTGQNKYSCMGSAVKGIKSYYLSCEIEVISKTRMVYRRFANQDLAFASSELLYQLIAPDNKELFLSQFDDQKKTVGAQQPLKKDLKYPRGKIEGSTLDIRRIALVMGNGNYGSARLKNPPNDAADISSILKRLGFSVVLKRDSTLQEMEQAIEDFGKRLKGGGVGLFYFAGHGLQVSGVNYIIPIDARLSKESDVKYKAVDVGKVLDEMANASNGFNIVILDSCRDNPFSRSFRSASRGLAIISSAPRGTLISYSTGPGQIARDGKGRNSPYTAALLKHMGEPDLPIEQVFKKVRNQLGQQTGGEQTPWELSSLEGDFYFNTGTASIGTGADAHETKVQQDENEPAGQIMKAKKKAKKAR